MSTTHDQSNRRTCRPRRAPAAEPLEARRMLSAAVQDGVLFVEGTSGPERIRVFEFREGTLQYDVLIIPIPYAGTAESHTIPGDGVRLVSVRALGGDDIVDVRSSPLDPGSFPQRLPTRVDAGIGNDTVYGSRARSFITGGFGNDTIYGADADDWINGGWGNDTISGGDGNDVIFGDRGDDILAGDFGNDRLSGGPGNDRLGRLPVGPLTGEPGNDFMDGGDGVDRIFGGAGTDRLFGGPGRDVWLEGWSPAEKDTPAERVDRTPDEPIEMIPATV